MRGAAGNRRPYRDPRQTYLGALQRLDTIVEAVDTSVRATSDDPRIFPNFRILRLDQRLVSTLVF